MLALLDEMAQSHGPGIAEFTRIDAAAQVGALLFAGLEGVHMVDFPAHAGLDDRAEIGQRAIVRLDPPLDRRLDVFKGDLQLENRQARIPRLSCRWLL